MTALLDVNVILDVLLAREPWAADAARLWEACDSGQIEGYVTAISLPIIFYIVRKSAGLDRARECVKVCLDAFAVCAVDRAELEAAHQMAGGDFEDNIQLACAIRSHCQVIVSRDKELRDPMIRCVTPAQALSMIKPPEMRDPAAP